jgi:asparagine synthase (glutamine-hydrolysing)
MCGLSGFINYKADLKNTVYKYIAMNTVLNRRGPDSQGVYISEHANLFHSRLAIIDIEGGKQPMTFTIRGSTYTIVYNGQLYNTPELYSELKANGFTFDGHCDTEVLLKGFIYYGYDVVNHLNGIFSFAVWNEAKQELFLARDHFGVKPLYYAQANDNFIFASEIKSIIQHPDVKLKINKNGIQEMLGLGPAHTPGTCVFEDIYELKPAHFAVYNRDGLLVQRYWKLKSEPHWDDFETTCDNIKFLLEDSIKRQLVSDVPICTMLSGGLDSSIVTTYAAKYYKDEFDKPLNTFSVDYIDNDKHFSKTDFQPDSDQKYIDLMTDKLKTHHTSIYIDTPDLFDALIDAMKARDIPGMADVDSSMLLFCKEIKKQSKVALSGECADEIFGGYPWFFRPDALNSGTFPWSIALTERQHILNADLGKNINLKEYIDFRYNESLSEVDILDSDTPETAQKRKIFYLNLNWFMQTLLDRTDRMAMYNGLEVRVPFCDYRLTQYMWNVPWEIKAYKGREKGLLRYIMDGVLPYDVVYRKKSPYPKTWNPNYLQKVSEILTDIVNNKNSPIYSLINIDYVKEILKTGGTAFSRPWYGQLMTGPQLMAYLIQVNYWLDIYKPDIII